MAMPGNIFGTVDYKSWAGNLISALKQAACLDARIPIMHVMALAVHRGELVSDEPVETARLACALTLEQSCEL